MSKRKQKHWSYKAGERGRKWVRTYRDSRDDKLYMEWLDTGWRFDPETGLETPVRRRRSQLLRGVSDEREAKVAADQKAAELGKLTPPSEAPIELSRLLILYAKEVTPTKGEGKQHHDRRSERLRISFFEAQEEPDRRSTRHPATLDRTDWNRFIQWRQDGLIPGWPKGVRNRQVQYDLKFLIAVLNWATGHKEGGKPLLQLSPWRPEIRRSQRWEMPKELNPHRPGMTEKTRRGLIRYAPSWQFGLALVLERETRRRNNSIRQLLWSDIDLEAGTVRWRGEQDKAGRESVTPLTTEAQEALRGAPFRGIGNTPVFPSATDPSQPTEQSQSLCPCPPWRGPDDRAGSAESLPAHRQKGTTPAEGSGVVAPERHKPGFPASPAPRAPCGRPA